MRGDRLFTSLRLHVMLFKNLQFLFPGLHTLAPAPCLRVYYYYAALFSVVITGSAFLYLTA